MKRDINGRLSAGLDLKFYQRILLSSRIQKERSPIRVKAFLTLSGGLWSSLNTKTFQIKDEDESSK